MNANTHTPAPWASDNTRKYYDSWLIRHNGIAVARVMQDTTRTKEEHEANAQLIASAPELLEALRRAQGFIIDVVHGRDWEGCAGGEIAHDAGAAIAKAEGKVTP